MNYKLKCKKKMLMAKLTKSEKEENCRLITYDTDAAFDRRKMLSKRTFRKKRTNRSK